MCGGLVCGCLGVMCSLGWLDFDFLIYFVVVQLVVICCLRGVWVVC